MEQNKDHLEKHKKARTAAKTRLTLATNKLKNIVGSDRTTKWDIIQAIEGFEQKLKLYDDTQMSLEQYLNIAELDTEVAQSEAFKEERMEVLIKAKELLERLTLTTSAETEIDEPVSNTASRSTHNQARLPQIELPTFSGDHTMWQSFWDKFTAIIHTSDLPIISKFSYLQSLLKGDALASINGLALTEANYDTALKILEQRFGRREKIVFCHIQQLLNLTSPGKSTSDLWALHDKLQAHIRSLESLGISGDTYGVILTPLVLHKLPENIRLEWARLGEGKECDLEALLSFLHTEILRRERSQTFRDEQPVAKSNSRIGGSYKHSTASALHVGGQNNKENRKLCGVCEKLHNTEKCFSWNKLDLNGRKNQCFEKGLCFLCLGFHKIKDCKVKARCKCSGKHHPLLCNKPAEVFCENSTEVVCENSVGHTVNKSFQVHSNVNKNQSLELKHTMLQTAKVIVVNQNNNQRIQINILFDSGSDRSYISSDCAKNLGLKAVGKGNVSVALFGQGKPNQPRLRNKYRLQLLNQNSEIEELIVTESPMICAPIRKSKLPHNIVNKIKRSGLTLADGSLMDSDSQLKIDVLIGLDYFWQLVKHNVCKITDYLSAQETKFGWVLSGSWENNNQEISLCHQFLCMTDIPEQLCHKIWDLDTIGITTEYNESWNDSDMKVLKDFNETCQFKEGRYIVQLPWIDDDRKKLEDNQLIARKRSVNLTKRLDSNPSLSAAYNDVLADMEANEIIHEVPSQELVTSNPTFYLPHRPVIREGSLSTKIRPVFDGSVKGPNGVSLNDCMHTGPNLIPSLIEILLRFRRWKFGLTSDITKAFLQIKVSKNDRDVHRFIWDVSDQTRVMRFDRVVFGNTCSPFLLNATIKLHLEKFENTNVVNELKSNLYVDDWLSGADTEEEIEQMIGCAKEIMDKGGFPLAKWGSNSPSLSASENTNKDFENNSTNVFPSLKILGMHWSTSEDCFYFEAAPSLESFQYSKRLVLSFTARIYDPMGLLNPFTIMVKILFQDLWRLGLGWDDPLPQPLQNKMSRWAHDFNEISRWKIPRCLCIISWKGCSRRELLVFADASERAFGCCVYLRVWENACEKTSLVASRVRVAPLKKITIPRMELLGAVLGARLLSFVRSALELPIDTPYSCYTDSYIVLHWIRADPQKWKQFVRNRVSEIQTLTSPSCWSHCPGKRNPADMLTRGISASELVNSDEWLQGPKQTENDYPITINNETNDETEIYAEMVHDSPINLVLEGTSSVIDFERFSDLTKAIRVVGWVLRFIANLKQSLSSKQNRIKAGQLESDELEKAKLCLFKLVQEENYSGEIKCLKRGGTLKKASPLYKLSPFIDQDGLLRIEGRLQMSQVFSYEEKHPIVLPKCHLSMLLVRFQHKLMKHAGVSVLLSSLRSNYWIFGLRYLCKKVCHQCIVCQRHDSRACIQNTAPLPADRIHRSPPFSIVGLDHAGPLYCSDTGVKKHYIVLFTCAVVRALHLELVPSLSLYDFMLAFRRFFSRRGVPSIIYSDNAKTFKAASALLHSQLGHAAPIWKFSIPLAPWYGGWWERLVRSTKTAMRKSLGRQLVSRAELETSLIEVEACINARPLTYVEEGNEPLTPSHFLLGRNSPFEVRNAGTDCTPQNRKEFNAEHQNHLLVLDEFWRIWRENYIKNLPLVGNGKSRSNFQCGDMVLINEENTPKLKWPLGRISRVIISRDGLVRAVYIKTEKGELVRPVQKLHKLEVSSETIKTFEVPVQANEPDYVSTRSSSRRTRKPRQVLDL